MALYYFGALGSFLLSFGLVTWLKKIARQRQIFMTEIRQRDSHTQPTPRVGGLGVVGAFIIVVLGMYLLNPDWFNFIDQKIWGIDRNLFGLIVAILVLSAANLADDYQNIHWSLRLLTQVLAASIVVGFGVSIKWLNNPFGDLLILHGALGAAFVIGWLVVLANTVNWLDGTDGLAGGVSAIALAVLFFLSVSPDVAQTQNALIAAIGFGAVLGFLPHNFSRHKAFLGDTGSIFLGFLIGVIAIISGGKVATAFLVLAIPFLDAVVVFFGRIIRHRSPFLPDRTHLPQRLLAIGLKIWQVNSIYYGLSLLFGVIALNTETVGKFSTAILSLVIMAGMVLLYSGKMKFKRPV